MRILSVRLINQQSLSFLVFFYGEGNSKSWRRKALGLESVLPPPTPPLTSGVILLSQLSKRPFVLLGSEGNSFSNLLRQIAADLCWKQVPSRWAPSPRLALLPQRPVAAWDTSAATVTL